MVDESEMKRLGSRNDEESGEELGGWRKKWLKRYSPCHQILLVGEGDFSFSSSLALAFGSASNITATSLDPYDAVISKYQKANSNLLKLDKLGASLLHGVDATIMKDNPNLRMRKFDRIIFNFPHAGFHGKEDDVRLINMHRELMYNFFRNASQMLRAGAEVHVSHKTKAPYCLWKLEELDQVSSSLAASGKRASATECTDQIKDNGKINLADSEVREEKLIEGMVPSQPGVLTQEEDA